MQKIFTRTVVGDELFKMMKAAGINRNETIRLTGFNAIDLDQMLRGQAQTKRPRMSDLILIRLLADAPQLKERLLAISDEFHDGEYTISTSRHARRAQNFGETR